MQIVSSNLQEFVFSICVLEIDAIVIKILDQNFLHFSFWGGGMCVLTLNPKPPKTLIPGP
jgi:hypothetical protein